MKLLLASKSTARRRMLEAAGVRFETIESRANEGDVKAELRRSGADPMAIAAVLAEAKALSTSAGREDLVLGSDQMLEQSDGSTLDKPTSRDEALAQLRALAGKPHRLHSAAAIVEDGRLAWSKVETVTLHMRPLGDAFLDDYLDREYDSIRHGVGGYRIEGPGAQLFEQIDGSHFAVLGLPLLPLLDYLRARGLLAR